MKSGTRFTKHVKWGKIHQKSEVSQALRLRQQHFNLLLKQAFRGVLGMRESLILRTHLARESISGIRKARDTLDKVPDWQAANFNSENVSSNRGIKAGPPPPLDLSFWSFSTFLHHGIEEVERHLLWKFYKKIRRKSWSNVLPKLVACIGFQYKGVHKIGRLRKFNRSRGIEFNFLTAWTISMKFGTLVQHALGYKIMPQIF